MRKSRIRREEKRQREEKMERLDRKSNTEDDRKNKNGGWRQRCREGSSRLRAW